MCSVSVTFIFLLSYILILVCLLSELGLDVLTRPEYNWSLLLMLHCVCVIISTTEEKRLALLGWIKYSDSDCVSRAGNLLRGEPAHPGGQSCRAGRAGADGASRPGGDQPQSDSVQHLPVTMMMMMITTTWSSAGCSLIATNVSQLLPD